MRKKQTQDHTDRPTESKSEAAGRRAGGGARIRDPRVSADVFSLRWGHISEIAVLFAVAKYCILVIRGNIPVVLFVYTRVKHCPSRPEWAVGP